jgi:hypothetical protein
LLIYSKHIEDIYWNKFRKKVHLVGSYYANKVAVCVCERERARSRGSVCAREESE